jgi:hypothetical protein
MLPGEEWSTDDLRDQFEIDADGDSDPVTDLAAAMCILDEMMGDDPIKWQGMEYAARALAALDDRDDAVTHVTDDGTEIQVNRHKRAGEP